MTHGSMSVHFHWESLIEMNATGDSTFSIKGAESTWKRNVYVLSAPKFIAIGLFISSGNFKFFFIHRKSNDERFCIQNNNNKMKSNEWSEWKKKNIINDTVI